MKDQYSDKQLNSLKAFHFYIWKPDFKVTDVGFHSQFNYLATGHKPEIQEKEHFKNFLCCLLISLDPDPVQQKTRPHNRQDGRQVQSIMPPQLLMPGMKRR